MLFYNLIRLLLPDQCLLCHRTLTKGEKSLCLVCQAKLPRIRGEKSDNEAEHRMFGRVDFVHGTPRRHLPGDRCLPPPCVS